MAEAKKKPGRPPGSKNKNTGNKSKSSGSKTSSKGGESKAKARAKEIQAERKADRRVIDEIWSLIFIAIGIFLIVAIYTGSAGQVGTIIGNVLKGLFGFIAHLVPFYIITYGVLLFAKKTVHTSFKSGFMAVMILIMFAVMNSVRFIDAENIEFTGKLVQEFYANGVTLEGGGFFGMLLGSLLIKGFGVAGCWIIALVTVAIMLLLLINTPVSRFISKIADKMEERKLTKENSHLDVLSEEKEELQITMADLQKNEKRFGFGSLVKKDKKQKVLSSSVLDEKASEPAAVSIGMDGSPQIDGPVVKIAGQTPAAEEPESEYEMPKREYVPPSQVAPLTPEKKNSILHYMQDDSLFGRKNKSGSGTGLEDSSASGSGYGLDGAVESSGTRGLDGMGGINSVDKISQRTPSGGVGLSGGSKTYAETDEKPKKDIGFGRQTGEQIVMDSSYDMSRNEQLASQSSGTKFVSRSAAAAAGAAGTAGAAAAAKPVGTPAAQMPERMTNKEAREAMLTMEEIAENQKPVKIYHLPPSDLLTKAAGGARTNENVLRAKAMKLEETLKNFHVDARVVQVTQGPTVTRYEIQPAVGVKVSSIVRLADDIALNLEAKSIRMEAPIPGKAAVGIEVENDAVTMVKLREIIDSKEFKNAKSKITFAVGKDISGNAIVADLKSMPHLLIAGSTGSGKSVCINSIILSLLYKATPDEVKLILVDPKVVELGNYNGIPHLMIPVVTDPSKAAAALNWAVAEMTDRYKKFAEAGVRDLSSYNEAVRADGDDDKVMPQIVIIIDELADLMMAAPSQIEESICRLAQMARAAGMHLIVATQRPSVDVITGVIKANIPSRIAFAVSSQVDSRTILDMQGAEKLVGKGDMLFNPMGMGKPIRVQGTFVSDSEVHKVIEYVKGQVEDTSYNQEVLSRIERSNTADVKDDADELLPEAIDLVVRSGQASVSMLQRRFRIGYNRAARIVDMMEARGIIGPQDGSRPRQVLMTEAELEAMENGGTDENIL